MTAIAGIVCLAPDPVEDAASRWLKYLDRPGASLYISPLRQTVFARIEPRGRRGSSTGSGAFSDSDLLGLADARLTNRSELGAMLGLSSRELSQIDDSILLMRVYRRFGASGIARALGAFVFAVWDERAQQLVLGRDCLGERTLFFHRGDGFVAFASDQNKLLSLPIVPRTLDEDALANYLALNLNRPTQTFYRGIERVACRSLVTIEAAGVHRSQYWSPDFSAPPPFKKEDDYIARARELFDQAVMRVTKDTPRLAISTSGGLDSSAIAATAVRLGRAQSITCYTVIPPAGHALAIGPNFYFSEREKLEALAKLYPAVKVTFCEEGALHPFERNPVRFFVKSAAPALNPWLLGSFSLLHDRAAADGFSVLHNGRLGNVGLSWDGRFALLALLREGRIDAFAEGLIAASHRSRRGLPRTMLDEVVMPAAPPWLRDIYHWLRRRAPADAVLRYSALGATVTRDLSHSGVWRHDRFDPRFVHPGLAPAQFRANYLFDSDPVSKDFRASTRDIFGLEFRDPHGDRTLLEFLLRVPEWLYRQNGLPRSFARKVLADRLPPEIVNETRRGYQGATWFSRMDARRTEIGAEVERLEASPLASRLLDVPRMKATLDDWPRDADAAQARGREVRQALGRGLHVGQFIRWVEGANA